MWLLPGPVWTCSLTTPGLIPYLCRDLTIIDTSLLNQAPAPRYPHCVTFLVFNPWRYATFDASASKMFFYRAGHLISWFVGQIFQSVWFKWTSPKGPGTDTGFPVGGGTNPPRGASTYNFAKFSEKLHEIEKILVRREEGRALRAPPLDPPLRPDHTVRQRLRQNYLWYECRPFRDEVFVAFVL